MLDGWQAAVVSLLYLERAVNAIVLEFYSNECMRTRLVSKMIPMCLLRIFPSWLSVYCSYDRSAVADVCAYSNMSE